MKKNLLLFLLIFSVTSLFSQKDWKTLTAVANIMGTDAIQFVPGKILDNGQTVWIGLCTNSTLNKSWAVRSTDGGVTWTKSPPFAGRICGVDAISASTAFVGTTNGEIYKTTDGGATWVKKYSYTSGFFDGLKCIDNNTIVAYGDGDAAGHFYYCRSTDAGETFTQTPYTSLPNVENCLYAYMTSGTDADSYGNNLWLTVYGSSSNQSQPFLVKSSNGGATLYSVKMNIGGRYIRSVSFKDTSNGMVVDNLYGVYKTTDAGMTWSAVTLPKSDAGGAVTIRGVYGPKGTNTMLLLGSIEGTGFNKMATVWSTTDMGTTWVKDNLPPSNFMTGSTNSYISGAVMKDANTGFAFGADGPIYQTGIPTVSKSVLLAPEVQLDGKIAKGLIFIPGKILDNGNTIWFCGWRLDASGAATQTVPFVSTDAGKTFTQGTAVLGGAASIDAYSSTVALIATDQGVISRTTDAGKTWTAVHSYTISGNNQWFDGLKVINDSVVVAFADLANAGDGLYVIRSTDQGKTFTKVTNLPSLGTVYNGIYSYGGDMCTYGNTIWITGTDYAVGNGKTLISTDAGLTWKVAPLNSASKYAFTISFGNAKNGFYVDNALTVFSSNDGGNTFTKLATPPASATINAVYAVPNSNLFVALGSKTVGAGLNYYAAYTTDLGVTWTEIPSPPAGTGEKLIGASFLNENFGYLYSSKGWVMKFGVGTPTGVESPYVSIPNKISLDQNYPNPFNPSTMIKFNIPESENVKLVIYDALGRIVSTLVNDRLSAGSHEYRFNASNLTSGVYYYSLIMGNNVETKKMMLMK